MWFYFHYVDDLLIASNHPKGLVELLSSRHKFKLKGTGPTSHHLGCDFGRDDDGALNFSLRKCIEKVFDCHFNMFGPKPKFNVM